MSFLFEASVGGGIPVLHPLSQCLGANEILEVRGILNGTTNFILTQMLEFGQSYDAALRTRRPAATPSRTPPPTSTASTPDARSASWPT